MYKRLTAAATVSAMAAALVMAAAPAQAAPRGGTTTNFCNNLRVNGEKRSWEMHYDKVDHSFEVYAPGIHRNVYCKDPAFNNLDCLASVTGLVFTFMGAGLATRAVISFAGGSAFGVGAIWESC